MALRGVAFALATLLVIVHSEPREERSAYFRSPYYYTSYSSYPTEKESYPEWFEADDAEECNNVPDTVNTGKPNDRCDGARAGDRFCICMKTRQFYPYHGATTVYVPMCGECRDPCALQFVMDKYPMKKKDIDDDDVDADGYGGIAPKVDI